MVNCGWENLIHSRMLLLSIRLGVSFDGSSILRVDWNGFCCWFKCNGCRTRIKLKQNSTIAFHIYIVTIGRNPTKIFYTKKLTINKIKWMDWYRKMKACDDF